MDKEGEGEGSTRQMWEIVFVKEGKCWGQKRWSGEEGIECDNNEREKRKVGRGRVEGEERIIKLGDLGHCPKKNCSLMSLCVFNCV